MIAERQGNKFIGQAAVGREDFKFKPQARLGLSAGGSDLYIETGALSPPSPTQSLGQQTHLRLGGDGFADSESDDATMRLQARRHGRRPGGGHS